MCTACRIEHPTQRLHYWLQCPDFRRPRDISADWITGNVYWTDHSRMHWFSYYTAHWTKLRYSINVGQLKGPNCTRLITDIAGEPYAIAVNPARGWVVHLGGRGWVYHPIQQLGNLSWPTFPVHVAWEVLWKYHPFTFSWKCKHPVSYSATVEVARPDICYVFTAVPSKVPSNIYNATTPTFGCGTSLPQ